MQPVVMYTPPAALVGMLALPLVFVAGGVAILLLDDLEASRPILSIITVGLGITMGVVLVREILVRTPLVIMDDRGIELPKSRIGPIPWNMILGVRRVGYRPVQMLRVLVTDLTLVLAQMNPLRRFLCRVALFGSSPLLLPALGFAAPAQITAAIEAGIASAKERPSTSQPLASRN